MLRLSPYAKQQIEMIKQLDQCMRLVRDSWIGSLDPNKGHSAPYKEHYAARIDTLLEQRSILMRNRDRGYTDAT